MVYKSGLIAAVLAASVMASPTPITNGDEVMKRASTCTFSGASGAAQAMKEQASCSTITLKNLQVPAGTTLDLTKVKANTRIVFEGETTFGYKEWEGPLLSIAGTGLTVEGASGSVLNGLGEKYWDGKGSNGGKTKPKFFAAHKMMKSSINNITIKNAPVQVVSINGCDNLTVNRMHIDNKDGDSKGGHNTDGFDIGSSNNIHINAAQVYNQDDCVAINSGTNIKFDSGLCSGGHGLSIGSVGGRADNTVTGVTFSKSTVQNSDNGIRIKAKKDTTGNISNIVYEDITLSKIAKYGVLIEQNYDGGDLHGEPTNKLPISHVTVNGLHGAGAIASGGHNMAIVCGSGSCANWTWKDVKVSGGKKYDSCKNIPGVVGSC
ncbi:polygalacturonase [Diaporthe helianthi]|uniref:endo-polygalacturonase n=1 Tax=Diaporthe helianthi TaxID=158607 RepID=A0A2P5HX34_DIAHE|nr:polygalacturonase [Diaporthe helianthi]